MRFRRHLQHVMRHLALAAILLLALVPTVGRLVDAGRDAPSLAGLAMCTGDGLAWSPSPALFRIGDPMPTGKMGADCDYCPLLASAVPVVLATLLLLTPAASPPSFESTAAPPRDARLAHGLGARGPPLLS